MFNLQKVLSRLGKTEPTRKKKTIKFDRTNDFFSGEIYL